MVKSMFNDQILEIKWDGARPATRCFSVYFDFLFVSY